ncbi:putative hemolysin [Lachnospiraceae bacterium C10]|nr:putative hemolysin [Lachnospiraceae bacterium C10]
MTGWQTVAFGILILFPILEIMITATASALENRKGDETEAVSSVIKDFGVKRGQHIRTTWLLSGVFYLLSLTGLFLVLKPYSIAGYYRVIVVLLHLFLYLLFCVYLPVYVGAARTENVRKYFYVVYSFFYRIVWPVQMLLGETALFLARIFGVNPKRTALDVTEEEILSMVNESHEQGNLRATEAEMIQNIFAFDDKDAKDIMTHRGDIIALDGESTLEEAIHVFDLNHFSRFPVYTGSLDNIIGTIHMKELLHVAFSKEQYQKKIRDIDGLIRKAEFVPETHSINTLFTQMQFQKVHMVLVLDEYGQTSGLISMEDILEEIVGNIEDEHDDEKRLIRRKENGDYLVSGMTPLLELEELLHIQFKEEDIETLNGFLMYHLGHVPKENEKFVVKAYGYKFCVLSVKNRVVEQVQVCPLSS